MGEFERNDGSVLTINQCEVGDVGCVVWDAALVLTSYLDGIDFLDDVGGNKLTGKTVVELGAGTGIVGLQAAAIGAHTIITDLKDFIPLMDLNIKTNSQLLKGSCKASELNWGIDTEHFKSPDFLLIADCIYYPESIEPLVQTIKELSETTTTVLCCYEERTTDNKPALQKKFFDLIAESFEVEEVPMSRQDPVYSCEEIHIMKFTKR